MQNGSATFKTNIFGYLVCKLPRYHSDLPTTAARLLHTIYQSLIGVIWRTKNKNYQDFIDVTGGIIRELQGCSIW